MCGSCIVICPICNRPLQPDLTDRTLYFILGDSGSPLANVRAYTCGAKGHIIIVSERGKELSRPGGAKDGKDGAGSQRILNGWKEIGAYLGRGVRTVQRWETQAGLPVHRPKGRNRSAVLAFAEELDAWLLQTPVRFLDGNLSTAALLIMPPEPPLPAPPAKRAPSGVR